jgi:5-oxoprolinase (ATP-hydrolysing) subunit A
MAGTVDINCDLGESFGAYTIGDDTGMMAAITSASIACGFHGGDPVVMERTIHLALERGVAVGAHPGFPDLAGFGRREMRLSPDELRAGLIYQIGALSALAQTQGAVLQHVKPHGALYNMAASDEALARTIAGAVAAVDPRLILVVLDGSVMERAARDAGLRVAREAFGDRAYQRNGTLAGRSRPGALVIDSDAVARRVVRMVTEGVIDALGGGEVRVSPHTICFHGDTPGAPRLAGAARDGLTRAGVEIAPMGRWL